MICDEISSVQRKTTTKTVIQSLLHSCTVTFFALMFSRHTQESCQPEDITKKEPSVIIMHITILSVPLHLCCISVKAITEFHYIHKIQLCLREHQCEICTVISTARGLYENQTKEVCRGAGWSLGGHSHLSAAQNKPASGESLEVEVSCQRNKHPATRQILLIWSCQFMGGELRD